MSTNFHVSFFLCSTMLRCILVFVYTSFYLRLFLRLLLPFVLYHYYCTRTVIKWNVHDVYMFWNDPNETKALVRCKNFERTRTILSDNVVFVKEEKKKEEETKAVTQSSLLHVQLQQYTYTSYRSSNYFRVFRKLSEYLPPFEISLPPSPTIHLLVHVYVYLWTFANV